MESQLSGAECVLSRLVLEKYSSFTDTYTPILIDQRCASFRIGDGSGRLLVETKGADFRLGSLSDAGWAFLLPDGHAARTRAEASAAMSVQDTFSLGPIQSYILGPPAGSREAAMAQTVAVRSLPESGGEPTEAGVRAERLNAFLDSNPSALAGLRALGPGFIRVSEQVIRDGAKLYVLGTASVREGPGRADGPDNLLISGGPAGALVISDQSEKDLLSSRERRVLSLLVLGTLCLAMALFLTL